MMNIDHKQSGYTLIELLVTVAIIGILAAIAVPEFHEYRKRAYDSAALSDLHNTRVFIESIVEDSYYQDTLVTQGDCAQSGVKSGGETECKDLFTANGYGYLGVSSHTYLIVSFNPLSYQINTAAFNENGIDDNFGTGACYEYSSSNGKIVIKEQSGLAGACF